MNGAVAVVLTFRLPVAQRASPRFARAPLFRPVWFADIADVAMDARSDGDEIAESIGESCRVPAPKK